MNGFLQEVIAELEGACEKFYPTPLQKSEVSRLKEEDPKAHLLQLVAALRVLIATTLHDLESTRRELKSKETE